MRGEFQRAIFSRFRTNKNFSTAGVRSQFPNDSFAHIGCEIPRARPDHGSRENILQPKVVSEAWCHQRGYVCMIEEFGGRPVKPSNVL